MSLFSSTWAYHKAVELKFTLEQATKARREGEGVQVCLYSFFNLGCRWGGWSTPLHGRFINWKVPVPLYRRLGGLQRRSRRVRKFLPPPGFHPRTVQPVASRYTDWAIPAHQKEIFMWDELSFITFFNKIGNGRVKHVTMRRCRLTIAAVEKQ